MTPTDLTVGRSTAKASQTARSDRSNMCSQAVPKARRWVWQDERSPQTALFGESAYGLVNVPNMLPNASRKLQAVTDVSPPPTWKLQSGNMACGPLTVSGRWCRIRILRRRPDLRENSALEILQSVRAALPCPHSSRQSEAAARLNQPHNQSRQRSVFCASAAAPQRPHRQEPGPCANTDVPSKPPAGWGESQGAARHGLSKSAPLGTAARTQSRHRTQSPARNAPSRGRRWY